MERLREIFLFITRRLYPTGRVFWLKDDRLITAVHRVFNESEIEVYKAALDVLDSILPDNANFDEDDAADWERRLGIIARDGTSLEDRKLAIRRKYSTPGDIPARQHYLYLQGQLQAAGFDVYVHENRQPDGSGGWEVLPIDAFLGLQYGGFQYGDSDQYGPDKNDLEKVANYIDSTQDDLFVLPTDTRAVFFIGGQAIGSDANVPSVRKDEFRQLILNIKPAQTVGLLIINYT